MTDISSVKLSDSHQQRRHVQVKTDKRKAPYLSKYMYKSNLSKYNSWSLYQNNDYIIQGVAYVYSINLYEHRLVQRLLCGHGYDHDVLAVCHARGCSKV